MTPLESRIVGRARSLFADDLAAARPALDAAIGGSRILVIGGAGSIGSHTLATLARHKPAALHVVDHNENGLADLVRGIRAADEPFEVEDFLTLPFDYGGAPFALWLRSRGADYDHVLNFAALKHVRSEKDAYSILAMLETNVVKLVRLARLMAGAPRLRRLFCVSTDKAANPSSMMGATKRLMEHALFAPEPGWPAGTSVTSARFANVALSNGSLLQSWQMRLALGQPMACPQGCRRFFVSLAESGHLCTLAAFLGEDRSILIPALDPGRHLMLLEDVADAFLAAQGYEAEFTTDEAEARRNVAALAARGRWPVLLTPLDTAGEKPYEEFVALNETRSRSRFDALDQVAYLPPRDPAAFAALLVRLDRILCGGPDHGGVNTAMLRDEIARVEEGFARSHVASARSLDQRL